MDELATPQDAPTPREAELRRALLSWFAAVARDVPWRRTRDPYAIWLSEVMLQQTRVDTVVPYYERFLARFPHVGALADAPLDEVLSLWSGLGYYRRARELHHCAREIVARHGGRVPPEAAALRALPGIGAYTAGAIASIAFGRREPLVDGNVARVLSRLFGLEDDPKTAAGARRLWDTAARLVPPDAPGAFNQALMELGATVCTPRAPRCDGCPVRGACVARLAGREAELPVVRAKKAVPVVRAVAAVVLCEGRVLLGRRPDGGLFGGLWEPPMVEAASLRAARAPLADVGVEPERVRLSPAGRVRHVLSHRRLDVLVAAGVVEERFEPRARAGAAYERLAWLVPGAAEVGTSTLARKLIALASRPRRRAAT